MWICFICVLFSLVVWVVYMWFLTTVSFQILVITISCDFKSLVLIYETIPNEFSNSLSFEWLLLCKWIVTSGYSQMRLIIYSRDMTKYGGSASLRQACEWVSCSFLCLWCLVSCSLYPANGCLIFSCFAFSHTMPVSNWNLKSIKLLK